ncbi:hypothetical protein [Amycolatopsis panacis]|uniref:hypothetical protein n=1 Tax=Amycolatopsis panacis TaxID=2340917 RepID=UPI001F2497F3|nr:hypothetical protein [Amycolatopsis panacis]
MEDAACSFKGARAGAVRHGVSQADEVVCAMWLIECPSFWDEGLIRPLVTENGAVVLMCDTCSVVWHTPAGIEEFEHVEPAAPDWSIGPGTHVRPGTTRWADPADVTTAGWGDLRWRELPYAG